VCVCVYFNAFKSSYCKRDLNGTAIYIYIQGGSNMTGTDLCVNQPHCAAAVRH